MKRFKNAVLSYQDDGTASIYFSNTLLRFSGDRHFIVAHDVEYNIESGILFIDIYGETYNSKYFPKGVILKRLAGTKTIRDYGHHKRFTIGQSNLYERKLFQWYRIDGKFIRAKELYIEGGYYKDLNPDKNLTKRYIIAEPFVVREVESRVVENE